MPELPEIETLKKNLTNSILNYSLHSIVIRCIKLRYKISKELYNINNYQDKLLIKHILRQGRYLIIKLSKGIILIHLGMTGILTLLNYTSYNLNNYNHNDHIDLIINNFNINKILILRYTDYRRLGFWLWFNSNLELNLFLKQKLGIEPLHNNFQYQYLLKYSKSHRLLKNFIMDNKIITGIGNIYANEILFQSKISPLTYFDTLSINQLKLLVKIIKSILLKAIKLGGTSIFNFKNLFQLKGTFNQYLKVYRRNNQYCYRCRIVNISYKKISGRGTYFCLNCQK